MIRYEQFTKRFGAVTAVESLDLALEEGETMALIGPNGSGKTTTLKAALGLIRPTSGRVLVEGRDASRDGRDARSRIGYLPQRLAFPDGMTAREVLRFYAELRGVDPELRLLDRVGLLEAADRDVNGFSGGMRQRLGIAVALLGAPSVLVLDEPTASLDPSGALAVRDMIHAIRADGTAVLLSSHDLAEVAALADRIGVFVGGRLGALGTPADLARSLGLAVSTLVSTATGLESIYRRIAVAHPQLVA
ncbi:MAG TPA: ABC transporter ATP-binding protein [Gemmatimonadaceae bacterium]|jgi:ABC-type multidrug transport system ATPase subunit